MPASYSRPVTAPPAHDLTDAEFAELDDLLAATPVPLTPCDVVMLDGFLCGVIVQPVLLEPAVWLPRVFDFDGESLPDSTDAAWLERTTALIMRRHGALNRAMTDDGWFDPLILEFDDEQPPVPTVEGSEEDLAALGPISQAVMPWVAGFQHATQSFPDLMELPDEAVMLALARLFRHLPTETDDERELVETMNREHPLATLEDAIEDLVVTVADLSDLTREARFHVDTVKRDAPKVGRNDPCPCGSGKKFKGCHGKS